MLGERNRWSRPATRESMPCFVSVRTTLVNASKACVPRSVFRALRHLAGDHRGAPRACRALVGRFNAGIVQAAPHVTPVVMPAAVR